MNDKMTKLTTCEVSTMEMMNRPTKERILQEEDQKALDSFKMVYQDYFDDIEQLHLRFDELMLHFLKSSGYKETVKYIEEKKVNFWYV